MATHPFASAYAVDGGAKGTQAYIQQNFDQAFEVWRGQADGGDPEAMFGMGLLYAHGRGVEANQLQALRWYRLACEQDYVKGCYNAGLLEIDQASEPAAFTRAEGHLVKAAELGHPSAQHRLAIMYLRGEGPIKKNEAEARFWLEQAELADHGKSRDLLQHVKSGGGVAKAVESPKPSSSGGGTGAFDDVLANAQSSPVASLFGTAEPGQAVPDRAMTDEEKKREEEMRKQYRQGAKRNCPLSPDIPWWGNNSHGAIKSAVEAQYQGNWTSYFQKWSRYKQNLEKGLANNKVAKVRQFGISLKGPTLSGYIKKVDTRLAVIRCLQQESSGQLPGQ